MRQTLAKPDSGTTPRVQAAREAGLVSTAKERVRALTIGTAIGMLGDEDFRPSRNAKPGRDMIGRLLRGFRPPATIEAVAQSPLDQVLTPQGVETLFQLVLNRPVGDEDYIHHLLAIGCTYAELIKQLSKSDELSLRLARDSSLRARHDAERLDAAGYLTPLDLRPDVPETGKCLLIGSCLLDIWPDELAFAFPGWDIERVLFNNVAVLPDRSAQDMVDVDFQVLQPSLRFVLPDHVYFKVVSGDVAGEDVLAEAFERLTFLFSTLTTYTRAFSTPSFMLSFLTPQRHPRGRLGEVYAAGNTARLVEALNAELERLCRATPAAFFYDMDQTASTYGKKYLQDDSICHYNHGGLLGALVKPADLERIHPAGDVVKLYGPRHGPIIAAAFGDIIGAYRSLQQSGAIKLVIFDLDDTLWRGVAAEKDELDAESIEGWPLGMVEAVATLHGRGVLVAIASKNDPVIARQVWRGLYELRFPWENFFAHEVSWGDKGEAVTRIIKTANILPDATLFVDDNPVERARVKAALPGLRTIDAPLAEWRRILLWSPELQPPVLTVEARGRAASLKDRPSAPHPAEDREAFLDRLQVQVTFDTATHMGTSTFDRLFELLNKTNQFNTTGRRWTLPELRALFDRGGSVIFARVRDAFSDYGLTALAVIEGSEIVQVVMSCRVFGLGVEIKLLAYAIEQMRIKGAEDISARTWPTNRNAPSLGLFAGAGFAPEMDGDGRVWRLAAHADVLHS